MEQARSRKDEGRGRRRYRLLQDSFRERGVPGSFEATSATVRSLAKNWLKQQSVNRQVVLLLGFGLGIRFGEIINRKVRPELLGGIILIGIGVRILIEHLGS